jgi:hypothetical protein
VVDIDVGTRFSPLTEMGALLFAWANQHLQIDADASTGSSVQRRGSLASHPPRRLPFCL